MNTSQAGMLRRIYFLAITLIATSSVAYDQAFPPRWWSERNVVTSSSDEFANDQAPANQGQAKWFARQAYEEFAAKLPGAANSNIQQRIEGFTDQDNYLPVNIGQLKHLVSPCYNRLFEFGLAGSYPWDDKPDLTNDYAIATVGQLKDFFDFELPPTTNLYYVATDGDDANPGTLELPFRTIQHAVNQLTPGTTLLIRGGIYQEQITITNSGTAELPITISGYADESPRIIGAIPLDPADFELVTSDDPVWDRLHPDAKGNVLKLDLSTYTTNYGTLETRLSENGTYNSYIELFYKGEPMELARYPDKVNAAAFKGVLPESLEVISTEAEPDISGNYTYIDNYNSYPRYEMSNENFTVQIYSAAYRLKYYLEYKDLNQRKKWYATSGPSPCGTYRPDIWCPYPGTGNIYVFPHNQKLVPGFAVIEDTDGLNWVSLSAERINYWKNSENLFALGFWKHLWIAEHLTVSPSISQNFILELSTPHFAGFTKNHPFFVYNLIEELSTPNEWYLDTKTSTLYFWPTDKLENSLYISMAQDPAVFINRISYLTIKGITLEMTRDDLLFVDQGNNVKIDNCILRNCGGSGAIIRGHSCGLSYCEIYNSGSYGIRLHGGDRKTLTSGYNYVRNSDIHHFGRIFWTYRPGVFLSYESVGQIVEHNHIHDAPHAAIIFNGNNHRISYNDIHDTCEWTNDAGAIYGGGDWGQRGNIIANNFIHHIRSLSGLNVHGVYLDNCISGVRVSHNIFYDAGPRYPSVIGGGRDNKVFNNIFCDSAFGLHVDNRGISRITGDQGYWDMLWKLNRYDYQNKPWSTQYPELAMIPNNWEEISASHWLLPEGCSFSRNVVKSKAGIVHEVNYNQLFQWPLDSFSEATNNLYETDPLFVDEESMNLQLKADSPAFTIPGFEDIHFEKIGIQPR